MLTSQQSKEIETLHRQWIEHPLSRHLAKALDKQLENVVSAVANQSITGSADQLRCLATQVKTIKTIKHLIYDTPTFIAQCNS